MAARGNQRMPGAGRSPDGRRLERRLAAMPALARCERRNAARRDPRGRLEAGCRPFARVAGRTRQGRQPCLPDWCMSLRILFAIHGPRDPGTAVYLTVSRRAAFLRERGHTVEIVTPADLRVGG